MLLKLQLYSLPIPCPKTQPDLKIPPVVAYHGSNKKISSSYFICGEKQIFADVSVWYEWVVNKGNFRDPYTNELLRECDIARLKNQYRLLKRYEKMTEENRSKIVKLILEKPRSELTEVNCEEIHEEFKLPRLYLRTILFDLAKIREIMQNCV